MAWYFEHKRITSYDYLLDETLNYLEEIWGSDLELMVFSAIFNMDIYIANNKHRDYSLIRVVK